MLSDEDRIYKIYSDKFEFHIKRLVSVWWETSIMKVMF